MLRSYLLIAMRNLRKNWFFSLINIFGLAVGITSCVMIFFYVKSELNFDQFHADADRIYRVNNKFQRASNTFNWTLSPPPLAPALRHNFPEIEKSTRLLYSADHHFAVKGQSFYENNVIYTDSVFLEIFDFPMIYGQRSALDKPNSIVLTESMALKYFGTVDVLDQVISLDGDRTLIVTGVMQDLPRESHLTFDLLISLTTYRIPEGYLSDLSSWHWPGFITYALNKENTSVPSLENKIQALYEENFQRNNIDNLEVEISLQPLTEIYLGSDDLSSPAGINKGSYFNIYLLSVIGILILAVATFNFMNISTAMAIGRSSEIGIRKVLGSTKAKVFAQFIFESVLTAIFSLVLALGFVYVLNFWISEFTDVIYPVNIPMVLSYLPLFFAASIVIGAISGVYPSIVLANTSTLLAIKGHQISSNGSNWFKNALMMFQFGVSVCLIAASIIIVEQLNYIRSKPLGFEPDRVLLLKIDRAEMVRHYQSLKNVLGLNSKVASVSQISHQLNSTASGPVSLGGVPERQPMQMDYLQVDHDFLEVMDIELVKGRFFQRKFTNDSAQSILLNESAVAELNLDNPIGQTIFHNNRERTIIGVFKDFHYKSLYTPMAGMALIMPYIVPEHVLVRLSSGPLDQAIESVQGNWNSVVINSPFEASFLDDRLNRMYLQEEMQSKLIYLFASLAMVLACLGLYGLVAFSINNKLREIGIRKVLGATLTQLLIVLSRHVVILMLVANLLSWPLIYYFGNQWLDKFAYRISIPWWIYFASGSILIVIAMLTISRQTIGAALTSPAKILKDE